jgi:hypothetical protein
MLKAEGEALASRSEAAVVGNGHTEVFVRIHRGIVDADLIMKMRAGRASTLSHEAYDVTAVHRLSRRHREAGKVTVAGADAVAVVDHDRLAVSAEDVAEDNNPIGRSNNRGAITAADIHAAMECAFSVKWIDALSKAACDLAFDRPKVGSRVRLDPVGGRGVAGQAQGRPTMVAPLKADIRKACNWSREEVTSAS